MTKDMLVNKGDEEEVIDMDITDEDESMTSTGESTSYDEYHENEKVKVSENKQVGEMAMEGNR